MHSSTQLKSPGQCSLQNGKPFPRESDEPIRDSGSEALLKWAPAIGNWNRWMHRFGMWPLLVAQQQDGDVIIFRPLDLLHQNIENLRSKDKGTRQLHSHKMSQVPSLSRFN